MKHTISDVIQLSIANGDGDINDYVPNLTETDPPHLFVKSPRQQGTKLQRHT